MRRYLVVTTRILVLRLAAEPFLLDTRHIQDIRVRKHFFQGAVISLQDKNPVLVVTTYSKLELNISEIIVFFKDGV